MASSDLRASVPQGLRLTAYSEKQVKGCYNYNQTLGICFDVRKSSMKLLKTAGEKIVFYMDLGPNMFYYQVVDQGFIGHGPSLIYVPDNIPKVPQVLREFLAMKQNDEETPQELELLKFHYQEVVSELHYVPEIHLLELVSVALSDNSTNWEILQRFRVLWFNLLKTSDIQSPAELGAAHDSDDETTDQHGKRKRRCSLASDPGNDNCQGMCGKGCSCWSFVCGDCCFHRGCYEHDKCCEKRFFSTYCLTPFFHSFHCYGFGGYPKCLRGNFWGK